MNKNPRNIQFQWLLCESRRKRGRKFCVDNVWERKPVSNLVISSPHHGGPCHPRTSKPFSNPYWNSSLKTSQSPWWPRSRMSSNSSSTKRESGRRRKGERERQAWSGCADFWVPVLGKSQIMCWVCLKWKGKTLYYVQKENTCTSIDEHL